MVQKVKISLKKNFFFWFQKVEISLKTKKKFFSVQKSWNFVEKKIIFGWLNLKFRWKKKKFFLIQKSWNFIEKKK